MICNFHSASGSACGMRRFSASSQAAQVQVLYCTAPQVDRPNAFGSEDLVVIFLSFFSLTKRALEVR